MPHWIDLALGMFLILFALGGWRRGLIRGIADGIGCIVGLLLAVTYMSTCVAWMTSLVHLPNKLVAIASFLGIFLVTVLGFRVLGNLLRRALLVTPLGWMDSGFGTLLGLFKGAFVLSLVLLFIAVIPLSEGRDGQMKESVLAGPIGRVAPFVFDQVKRLFPRSKDLYSEVRERLGPDEGASAEMMMEPGRRVQDQMEQFQKTLDESVSEMEKMRKRLREKGK